MQKWKTNFARIAPILILLLSSFFFLFLYHFDNKYMTQSVQATDGTLFLTKEELSAHPAHYLIQDWVYYPDVLLTPQDLQNNNCDFYYVSIGRQTFLGTGKSGSPHGCGTYMLQICLPEASDFYALELPEIFSTYRLYVNDRLLLQEGNPDPQNYVPLLQNRMVTFEGSETVTILIAASDYSHYYSGMVYPPAFGTPLALNKLRGLRMAIGVACNTAMLIVALLSLYFGLALLPKKPFLLQNTFLFGLLCLCICVSTSYKLVHTLFALSPLPWYALELTSRYAVTLLVLILHNRICNITGLFRRLSTGFSVVVCLAAFFYATFASSLTAQTASAFSLLLSVYKLFIVVYLILCSCFYDREQPDTLPFFYSTLIYACSFFWDRVLPDYEPILSGWFSEWGCLAMVCCIGLLLWRTMLRGYSYGLTFKEEEKQMQRQLAMQAEYSRQLAAQNERNRRLTHDFRHLLLTIYSIAEQGHQAELLRYLKQVTDSPDVLPTPTSIPFCSNVALDALLHIYQNKACEKEIAVNFRIALPDKLTLSDVELCTILSNLLENTYDEKLFQKNSRFLSCKPGAVRYGIGLESVQTIVEKHGGTLDIFPQKTLFRVGITLPLLLLSSENARQD